MSLFEISGALIVTVALLGVINLKTVKLPDTLGITLFGLIASVLMLCIGAFIPDVQQKARSLIDAIDFNNLIFNGILGLLLFAGSLHVNLSALRDRKWSIGVMATVSVVISTVVIAVLTYYAMPFLGLSLPFIYCLLFGALISPTDPIAVLAVLKSVGVSQEVETDITGESLFNDGSGVVLFQLLLGVLAAMSTNLPVTPSYVLSLLASEVVGALGLGLLLGYGVMYLLRQIDSYAVEILLTLSIPTAGYALAAHLHASAPLTVVVAGLIIGNKAMHSAVSDHTRERMVAFWDLIDELLNLLLFGLIGLKMLSFDISGTSLLIGVAAIGICLVARGLSVGIPLAVLRHLIPVAAHSTKIFTWAGLRGAISIALALSLPAFEGKAELVIATYFVVLFSLLVQALTLPKLLKSWQTLN